MHGMLPAAERRRARSEGGLASLRIADWKKWWAVQGLNL
jgi:hypothetical protein